jgi:hypothetical protein
LSGSKRQDSVLDLPREIGPAALQAAQEVGFGCAVFIWLILSAVFFPLSGPLANNKYLDLQMIKFFF